MKKVELLRTEIQLLAEKAMHIPMHGALVIADLHFGKVNHFRRAGLPVPTAANRKNTESLIDLVNEVKPERVIFLGDLFHSTYNDEWEVVGQIVRHFPQHQFELIRGNHDVMSARQYERHGINVTESCEMGPFILTHEPMEMKQIPVRRMNIAGHLHPGAFLQGKGRQAVVLPCFWISRKQLLLPAFGSFTGLARIHPATADRVYVILENKIMEVFPEKKSAA